MESPEQLVIRQQKREKRRMIIIAISVIVIGVAFNLVYKNTDSGKKDEKAQEAISIANARENSKITCKINAKNSILSMLIFPDSYQEISSRSFFLNDSIYQVTITYRAKNSFGGYADPNTETFEYVIK